MKGKHMILEYLGGIETSVQLLFPNQQSQDFRIPRRDWNSIFTSFYNIFFKTILEYLGGIETSLLIF